MSGDGRSPPFPQLTSVLCAAHFLRVGSICLVYLVYGISVPFTESSFLHSSAYPHSLSWLLGMNLYTEHFTQPLHTLSQLIPTAAFEGRQGGGAYCQFHPTDGFKQGSERLWDQPRSHSSHNPSKPPFPHLHSYQPGGFFVAL